MHAGIVSVFMPTADKPTMAQTYGMKTAAAVFIGNPMNLLGSGKPR